MADMSDDKKKALAAALGQIEKQFGKGSIFKMDGSQKENIEAISTGSIGLDVALGIGGVPQGRIIEIFGPESSGKTTFSKRLSIQLKVAGLKPFLISIDNYFVNRDPEVTFFDNKLAFFVVEPDSRGDLDFNTCHGHLCHTPRS